MTSYAYIHCKPDGTPFYVGKGVRARYKNFRDRNNYHKKIVAKYGQENILVGKVDCSSNEIALSLEIGIIKCFKRMGVPLANFTDGGQGALGRPCSEKTKAAVAKANARRIWTEEQRQKIGEFSKGKPRPEHAIKMASKKLWAKENNPFFGRGEEQTGVKNHMARAVVGHHVDKGSRRWDTLQQAADALGVTIQAVCQAIKKNQQSKGWVLEYAT